MWCQALWGTGSENIASSCPELEQLGSRLVFGL